MMRPTNPNIDTVARTIYGEARGQRMLDQIAVAAVIRERALRPGWWGRGWQGVCKAPWQFTCWASSDPNYARILEAEHEAPSLFEALYGIASYAVLRMNDRDVCELFGVSGFDQHPTHYFSLPLTEPPKAWGTRITEVYTRWESAFRFYVVEQGRPGRGVAS